MVAETGSFTRAAEQMHVAQPSLSYTIRQLEARVGFQIFARTTRSLSPTPTGEVFLAEAAKVIDQVHTCMHRLEPLSRGEAGVLRVGYLIGAAVEYVPQILREFGEEYPGIRLELLEYDFASPDAGLDTDETDVAIVRPPLTNASGVQGMTLLRERQMACVPDGHRFANRTALSIEEILTEPIIAAPGSNPWRDSWLLTERRQSPPEVVYEAATFEAEFQAVAMGRGMSIVPESASKYFARPGIHFTPIESLPQCEVAVVWRVGSTVAATNFARTARRVVAQGRAPEERSRKTRSRPD